jgi:hypothetical protein
MHAYPNTAISPYHSYLSTVVTSFITNSTYPYIHPFPLLQANILKKPSCSEGKYNACIASIPRKELLEA